MPNQFYFAPSYGIVLHQDNLECLDVFLGMNDPHPIYDSPSTRRIVHTDFSLSPRMWSSHDWDSEGCGVLSVAIGAASCVWNLSFWKCEEQFRAMHRYDMLLHVSLYLIHKSLNRYL